MFQLHFHIDPVWTFIFGFWGVDGWREWSTSLHFPTKTWNEKQSSFRSSWQCIKNHISILHRIMLCILYVVFYCLWLYCIAVYSIILCDRTPSSIFYDILNNMWHISLSHMYTVHSFDFFQVCDFWLKHLGTKAIQNVWRQSWNSMNMQHTKCISMEYLQVGTLRLIH